MTRSSILGLELLRCTSPRAATLPCSEPPWRSGRRMWVMSARVSWPGPGWLLSCPFCTLHTQLVTPQGRLNSSSHQP